MPIQSVAGESIPPGDAMAVAQQYVDRLGLASLYVADLDAIEQRTPQQALVGTIASIGVTVWLDAGVTSVDDARGALDSGASRLIVGLETMASFQDLGSIVSELGPRRIVFSLDLRDGKPIAATPELKNRTPEDLLARAADAGVSTAIVLDLARVGARSGFDLPLLSRLRDAARSIAVYAGGGVRSIADIEDLRSIGCDGALVASALLDGDITARDLASEPYLAPST